MINSRSLVKAVCGCGEYKFTDEYKSVGVSQDQWLQMTPEQRKSKIDRAMKCELKKDSEFNYIESNQLNQVDDNEVSRLSVNASDAHISHLQPRRIQKLWQKAEDILRAPIKYNSSCSWKQASMSSQCMFQ